MTTKYDGLFSTEGHGIPVPFLRALAKRESNFNPLDAKGPAWGLMQVGIDKRAGNVLQSYNKRHGTSHSKQDMLDPRLNVRVASELLARIVRVYEGEGIEADWNNANFVGLVVAGWNSGYSKKAGTARVLRWLKERDIPLTLAAVYKQAPPAGATRHLSNKKKQKWQRSVVALYLKEVGIEPTPEAKGTDEWLPLLVLLALLLR